MHQRFPRTTPSLLLGLATVGVCLAIAGCSSQGPAEPAAAETAAAPAPDPEDLKLELLAAHKALINAMQAGDVPALTALLDPNGEVLIFHPFVEDRFTGIAAVDEGFSRMFEALSPLSWNEAHGTYEINGDVGWLTSQIVLQSPALPSPFHGRATEIWVHGPEGWRLAHAHWSNVQESMPGF